MKISTRGRYAVRVMLDLALHNTGEYIKVKDIARRQDISEKYLEQIISILNKAGFVHSVRGAQGGYQIADDPKKYTIGMILRLTEGSLSPVACLDNGTENIDCARKDDCLTLSVWTGLYKAINEYLDSISIKDIVESGTGIGADDYII